jgi:cytochrome c oxidase cbb3-type subunit 3
MTSVGSANLTDAIWTVADVPGAASDEERFARVRNVISNGVHREMPSWEGRLSAAEIKLLTVYVHSLGGGK